MMTRGSGDTCLLQAAKLWRCSGNGLEKRVSMMALPGLDLNGEGAAVWQTQRTALLLAPALPARFRLTNPKLHMGAVSSFVQDALQVKALEQNSLLGGLVG